jgi:hypothetical protein
MTKSSDHGSSESGAYRPMRCREGRSSSAVTSPLAR